MSPVKKLFQEISYGFRMTLMGFRRFNMHFMWAVRGISATLSVVTLILSLAAIMLAVVAVGFEHTTAMLCSIHRWMRVILCVFAFNVSFNIVLNLKETVRNSRPIKWIVDISVLVMTLAVIYPEPVRPWIPWLKTVMYNNYVLYSVVLAYATVSISYDIIKVIGKRTNPSLMLSTSFLFLILVGSLLLMLPKCTIGGISYIDSLYVSTSAVCICGLTPVDVATVFTPFGWLILGLLIQAGGLGVMTFTSFFALFFSGNTSIYSQLMVKDMIYSKTINSLLPTLLYIFGFTLFVEAVGALFILLSIHGTLGLSFGDEMIFAAFHSVSSFCNAGFSTFPGGLSNPLLFYGNQWIYVVVSIIVIAGGIGFPILVNFRDAVCQHVRRAWNRLRHHKPEPRRVHLYDMNTKIVLYASIIILVVSVVLFFCLEYNNTLWGMSLPKKLAQSLFNSIAPRSVGFSSLNPADFLNVTLVFILFLMWIGGGSQSTAGGIKVNTFAAIWLNLQAIIKGRRSVNIFNRAVSPGSIRRANAVVATSILAYTVLSLILLFLEPDLSAKAVLFESASALFTVGSSLGITAALGPAAKAVCCVAMFIGRVGIISLFMGLAGKAREEQPVFPSENIIIN
ncbi:MAG: hypothetical protein NC117_06395 [Pseudoflavonifractor sp.]|nr:hypothetical protein [Pseudoflavonifractor sp.]